MDIASCGFGTAGASVLIQRKDMGIKMKEVKYLILGAGVSGLSFANQILSDQYMIIEREPVMGGYCRTFKSGEYVWDFAGHFFHFSHAGLKKKFESIISSDDTVNRVKDTRIYYKGSYVDYPFQKNIHQLSKEEMIECLVGLYEKTESDSYDSFLQMLYGKFGEGITEKFLKPYNEKLYACDLNMLDVDAMGRFFPYADVKEIILNMKKQNNASYNQTFIYPKKGAESYVEKLLEGLDKKRIYLNEEVVEVDIDKKAVRTNKGSYRYEYLISSIPLDKFARISHLAIEEGTFTYNQVLVLNLGFDKPSVDKNVHWIYIPDKTVNFYRAGFYNNIIGTENLSMYIEIGYQKDDVVDNEEISRQLKLTLQNLQKMKIIDDHVLVDHNSVVMNPAYVHITKKSLETVHRIQKDLERKNAHIIGRYGQWKYCSIEDCMIDALKVKERIG